MDIESNEILDAEIDRLGRVIFLCNVGMKSMAVIVTVSLGALCLFLFNQPLAGKYVCLLGMILFGLNVVLLLAHQWMARHWTWLPKAK